MIAAVTKVCQAAGALLYPGEEDGDCRESGQYREQAADLAVREYGSSAEEGRLGLTGRY